MKFRREKVQCEDKREAIAVEISQEHGHFVSILLLTRAHLAELKRMYILLNTSGNIAMARRTNWRCYPAVTAVTAILNSFLFCPSVDASEALFKPLYAEGKKNVDQLKNYAEGERLLEMALQNAEHIPKDSPEMLNLLTELCQAYTCTGKVTKAEPILKAVLEVREKSKKKDDLALFQTVMQLGTVYRRQDKYAESEALYKRGLSMFEGKGPIKTLFQALVMYALASLYLDMNKNLEAETIINQALILRKQSMFSKGLPESGLYEALGRALFQQGKYAEAETKYKLALETLEKKPENNRDLAFIEGSLSAVYKSEGRYDESRKLLEDSIRILEKTDGPESTNVANAYNKFAETAIAQDRYEEAETYVRKAMAIHEKLNGNEHSNIANDMSNLIDIYRSQGKYSAAETLGKKGVEIYSKVLGPDSVITAMEMEKLAWVYCDQAKYADAKTLCKNAIDIVGQREGQNSNRMPKLWRQLAFIEKCLNNNAEAERLLLQTSTALAQDKNAEQALVGFTYSELAALYVADHNLAGAEDSSKKAIAVEEKLYGADHIRLLGDLNLLSRIYVEEKRDADAAAIKARIDTIYDKHPELKKLCQWRRFLLRHHL